MPWSFMILLDICVNSLESGNTLSEGSYVLNASFHTSDRISSGFNHHFLTFFGSCVYPLKLSTLKLIQFGRRTCWLRSRIWVVRIDCKFTCVSFVHHRLWSDLHVFTPFFLLTYSYMLKAYNLVGRFTSNFFFHVFQPVTCIFHILSLDITYSDTFTP